MWNALDAQAYIVSHSHKATFTPDGLLAITEVVIMDKAMRHMPDGDDNWFEELMVFPIDASGMVDGKAIRAWLGY